MPAEAAGILLFDAIKRYYWLIDWTSDFMHMQDFCGRKHRICVPGPFLTD